MQLFSVEIRSVAVISCTSEASEHSAQLMLIPHLVNHDDVVFGG